MGQINSREIVLLGTTTVTTNGSGPDINLIQGWQAATVLFNVSAISGTSPQLNVFIQRKLGQPQASDLAGMPPTGTPIYDDLWADGSAATATKLGSIVTHVALQTANTTTLTNADWINSNQATAASTLRLGSLGGTWRVAWTVAGTTPSCTFALSAQLIPWAT